MHTHKHMCTYANTYTTTTTCSNMTLVLWNMPIMPALRRLGQESRKIQAIQDHIAGLCLKTNHNKDLPRQRTNTTKY